MDNKTCFLSNHCAVFNQILYVSFKVHGNESLLINAGHLTKTTVKSIFGKIIQKSSLEPAGRFPGNLVRSIG